MSIDPATERFELAIKVLPEDIDLFDHVNNVVYVRWVQEVSTAHWLAAATDAWKEALGWVVVRHEIDYLNPARLGDEIIGRTWVGAAQKHIFERFVEIVRVRDQVVLARARSLWCPIDLRSRRLTRVGAEIYERFSVNPKTGSLPANPPGLETRWAPFRALFGFGLRQSTCRSDLPRSAWQCSQN